MSIEDLLPMEGLPRAQNKVTADHMWTLGDTREGFLRNGGHHLFGPSSIRYQLNSLGYRCPEFSDPSVVRMISIGCSYTFGVGLPQNVIYHELFANKLRSELNTSVVNWNLASGAVSNDYIARVMHYAVPILQPDIVLILFTHLSRREYLAADNKLVKYRPRAREIDPTYEDVFKNFEALTSKYDDQLNFMRDYKSIEALLVNRFWSCSFFRRSEVNNVISLMSKCNIAPDHVSAFHRLKGLRYKDTARDHLHPGPKTHESIFQCFWKWFEDCDGVDRLSRIVRLRF